MKYLVNTLLTVIVLAGAISAKADIKLQNCSQLETANLSQLSVAFSDEKSNQVYALGRMFYDQFFAMPIIGCDIYAVTANNNKLFCGKTQIATYGKIFHNNEDGIYASNPVANLQLDPTRVDVVGSCIDKKNPVRIVIRN